MASADLPRCCLLVGSAPAALRGIVIEASVVDLGARVCVTQEYTAPAGGDARYEFPLDANAAITGFVANVNGETTQAVLKAKDDAKKT